MNTSAWNRPFDDLSSDRVRLEAEAVANPIAAAEDGRAELVASDYVELEVSMNPNPEVMGRVVDLMRICRSTIRLSDKLALRARHLESVGLRGLDALHVAAAESASVTALVTTDGRMIRRVARAGHHVKVRVVRPQEALEMIEEER